ncbi:HMG (high mobility group) box protein [Ceratobasidium sp. AG-Ba]|nr:HMG (high mobility group) box protein [Ceratobasidium sp. AG-Ba]QRW07196.1 HMG (high mobility group) box protein [Ceratobasidium sp. AG-Ba]
MFASRMLLRVPGQSLYLPSQTRLFTLSCIALEPPKKVVPPPPPPPPSKRTTKNAPTPAPEQPTTRKRLVLSDKERGVTASKSKAATEQKEREKARLAKEKERLKAQKEKEKEKMRLKAQKEKEKEEIKKKLAKPYPAPPKRPPSAYIRYFMEHKIAGANVTETATATSEAWKALPESKKQDYAKKYEEELAQWKVEIADWVSSLNASQLEAARANREPATRDTAAFDQLPKRPANPYALFFKDFSKRPEIAKRIDEMAKKEAEKDGRLIQRVVAGMRGRLTGEEWRKLNEKEKGVYVAKYEELKKSYQANYGALIAQQKDAHRASVELH